MKIAHICLALAFTFGMGKSIAQEKISTQDVLSYLDTQAKDQEIINRATAPIKSRGDLIAYIASTPKYLSPLELLTPSSKSRFIASLVFNENGLASYRYADLQNELTPTEIYKVLSLFGVQHTAALIKSTKVQQSSEKLIQTLSPMLMDDHSEYRCASHATCTHSTGDICMSSC